MGAPGSPLLRDRGFWTALALTLVVRAALIAVTVALYWDAPWLKHLLLDVMNWRRFLARAQSGLIPYVDIGMEYPVGAGLLYWLLRPLLPLADPRQTAIAHAALMSAVDVMNAALFYRLVRGVRPLGSARGRALGLTLLFSLSLTALVLGPARFDSVVVSFILLGCLAHRQGHPLRASLCWSLGSLVKWYPAVLIAAQELRALRVEGRKRHWVRSALVLAGVTVLANAPFALLSWTLRGNLDAWVQSYRFHLRRPLYWDTLLGVGQLWLGPLPFERYASLFSLALVAAALLAKPGMRLEHKGTLACVAGLLVNRVYSPQFHLWFYPLLLLGIAHETGPAFRRVLCLFLALDVLNVLVYPVAFAHTLLLVTPRPFGGWNGDVWTVVFSAAIVLRTACLMALGATLWRLPEGAGRDE